MARLRNFVSKIFLRGFRAVLFRMVPKPKSGLLVAKKCFRAVLFRMVPKLECTYFINDMGFRAVLFRMVPNHIKSYSFFK